MLTLSLVGRARSNQSMSLTERGACATGADRGTGIFVTAFNSDGREIGNTSRTCSASISQKAVA